MNEITIAYGRMNPITSGHDKLIKFTMDYAKKNVTGFAIFVSHTQDKKNNPLSYEEKVDILSLLYGRRNVWIYPDSDLTAIVQYLSDTYDKVNVVMGGDRSEKFKKIFSKHASDFSCEVEIIKFAERDKYLISATDLRSFACNGQYKAFMDNCPEGMSPNQKLEMYRKVAIALIGTVRTPNESSRISHPSETSLP